MEFTCSSRFWKALSRLLKDSSTAITKKKQQMKRKGTRRLNGNCFAVIATKNLDVFVSSSVECLCSALLPLFFWVVGLNVHEALGAPLKGHRYILSGVYGRIRFSYDSMARVCTMKAVCSRSVQFPDTVRALQSCREIVQHDFMVGDMFQRLEDNKIFSISKWFLVYIPPLKEYCDRTRMEYAPSEPRITVNVIDVEQQDEVQLLITGDELASERFVKVSHPFRGFSMQLKARLLSEFDNALLKAFETRNHPVRIIGNILNSNAVACWKQVLVDHTLTYPNYWKKEGHRVDIAATLMHLEGNSDMHWIHRVLCTIEVVCPDVALVMSPRKEARREYEV